MKLRLKTNAKKYFAQYGSPLLLDYAQRELDKQERIVAETEDWIAVVPYWAACRLKPCCCRKPSSSNYYRFKRSGKSGFSPCIEKAHHPLRQSV